MATISISDDLLESCRILLESRGVNTTGLKTKDIITRVIKYALGDTESLFQSPLPARIEKWKTKSLVYKSGGALAPQPILPNKVVETLQTKIQEHHQMEQVLNLPVDISAPPVDPDSPRPRPHISTPPWTGLKRIPLEEAHKYIHIKHPIVRWASGDEVKQIAAEVALAYVPKSLYNTGLLVETAEGLYKKFLEYHEKNS